MTHVRTTLHQLLSILNLERPLCGGTLTVQVCAKVAVQNKCLPNQFSTSSQTFPSHGDRTFNKQNTINDCFSLVSGEIENMTSLFKHTKLCDFSGAIAMPGLALFKETVS